MFVQVTHVFLKTQGSADQMQLCIGKKKTTKTSKPQGSAQGSAHR